MSLRRINNDDIEIFTLETNPIRAYSSSSLTGVTGTLNIFSRRSDSEKEVFPLSAFSSSLFSDKDINAVRVSALSATGSNISSYVGTYLSTVNSQSLSARKQQTVGIIRFEPSLSFTDDTLRKRIVVNNLMKYYRTSYPEAHFGFTNYHSLNFFTASNLPREACFIYPDPSGTYSISSSFTFDFWINPRYTTDTSTSSFKAGTILHRSSSYAISLITGSSKDFNGYPDAYRLILQLSRSTDFRPSEVVVGASIPRDLVFMSDDNSLLRSRWHHVTIRWGGSSYNLGSGSFIIDGNLKGNFVIPSASIGTGSFEVGIDKPNTLFIGNYFDAKPTTGLNQATYFFSNTTATREGLLELVNTSEETPAAYSLNHPLNAELHDLKIYGRYVNNNELLDLSSEGPHGDLLNTTNGCLLFYLPPFFTYESPFRTSVSGKGGVLITPFQEKNNTTTQPFNTDFSFGIGGHYINLENYTRDLATGRYPRLLSLTASAVTITSPNYQNANQYLYTTGSNLKRLLTILPNDNGRFTPSYDKLLTLSQSNFVNDSGNNVLGFVTLRNLIPTSSIGIGLVQESGSIVDKLFGASPTNISGTYNNTLTVYHRTRDNSSNQITMFDISNLYYGTKIQPGSFFLKDSAMSGSQGKVQIILRDDGNGNLYRSDYYVTQSTWNSVGNIFYNEGLILIKSPHLYFFGKEGFDMSFKGVQNIHILTFNLMARPLEVVSSSNPSYLPVSASNDSNDYDKRFVYMTGVQLHDENLNVVCRSSFAQPLVKRTGEKYLVKVKIDY